MSNDDLQTLFNSAIAHHQAGRLPEAEAEYHRVLQREPTHADALHFLGVIAYQRGDSVRAEELIRRALVSDPNNPEYISNLGLMLTHQGRLNEAAEQYQRALQLAPQHADGYYHLGVVRQAQRLFPEAIDCYRKAIQLNPQHVPSLHNLTGVLQVAGDRDGAIETGERTLTLVPDHLPTLLYLGSAYDSRNRLDDAGRCYEKVLSLQPDNTTALTSLSFVRVKQRRLDEAQELAERAIQREPNNPDGHKRRGLALKEMGKLEQACESFERSLELLRTPGKGGHGERHSFSRSSRSKLKHDIEQFEYLAQRGLLPETWGDLPDIYKQALASLPRDGEEGRIVALPLEALQALEPTYNRLVYRASAEEVEHAVNPELDRAAIEADYFRNEPGMTHLDGLLTPEALESLRRFCLESTFWFDFDHIHGYLGAYVEDGFYSPLLAQIARELARSLPGIFREHRLLQLWAYKYDSRLSGIEMHADFAAVNVNFWITPDEANLDPDSGGLVVWDKEAPDDWDFDEFNTDDATGQQRIQDFLSSSGAKPYVVPHRQNRAVIFNSDLFHKTDTINFREGYENRRINITMLFGRREQA